MGIIDTLTSYNASKKLEKYAKFAMFKGAGVSVSRSGPSTTATRPRTHRTPTLLTLHASRPNRVSRSNCRWPIPPSTTRGFSNTWVRLWATTTATSSKGQSPHSQIVYHPTSQLNGLGCLASIHTLPCARGHRRDGCVHESLVG